MKPGNLILYEESQRSTLFEKKYLSVKTHQPGMSSDPVFLWSDADFHPPSMFRGMALVIEVSELSCPRYVHLPLTMRIAMATIRLKFNRSNVINSESRNAKSPLQNMTEKPSASGGFRLGLRDSEVIGSVV